MNNPLFEQLSENCKMALCYLAYYVKPIPKDLFLNRLNKLPKMPLFRVADTFTPLTEGGFIVLHESRHYWDPATVCIRPDYAVKVLSCLFADHKEWIKKFERITPQSDQYRGLRGKVLDVIESSMRGETYSIALGVDVIEELTTILLPIFDNPDYASLFQHLPMSVVEQMLTDEIHRQIKDDCGDGIDRIVVMLTSRNLPLRACQRLKHLLQLGHYVQKGFRCQSVETDGSSHYLLMLEALELLDKQEYREACQKFADAAQKDATPGLRFGYVEQFWMDEFELLNLLYVIALHLSGDSACQQRLIRMATQSSVDAHSTHYAAVIFIQSIIEGLDVPIGHIGELFERSKDPEFGWVNQKIGNMFRQWHGISEAQIKEHCNKPSLCQSNQIHYYAHATQMADQMLQSIRIKAQWERTLEKIITSEQLRSKEEVPDDQKTSRISYFFSGAHHVEAREQSRLKNGNWSAGKRLSCSQFCYYSNNVMDELDELIKPLFLDQYRDSVEVHRILPLLEGTRRLYYGGCAPYICCLVREDKPYLSTSKTKNGISLSSNISIDQYEDSDESHLLYTVTETTQVMPQVKRNQQPREGILSYYRLPVRVRRYMAALLRVGTFPLEAEAQLKLLFEQIKGQIEIHSEMIEGGSTLPQVDGSSKVIIQISPVSDSFQVQAVVRPLADGYLFVTPGVGDSNVFDQNAAGERFQVTRNKREEKKNVKPLLDYMEGAEIIENSPFIWILDPYQTLELMEWIPEQGDDFVLEWPKGQKIKLDSLLGKQWNLSLKEKAGWFEMEGDVKIDQDTVLTVAQLLQLMGEGHGRFVKLKEGEYLRLTDSLRRQLNRLDAVTQNVRGKARISPMGAGLIADYLDGDIQIAHPKKIDELRQRIRKSFDQQPDIPDSLNATLRDYQTEGFKWITRLSSWGAGACLADDMGLGKTVQTITFLLHQQADGASMVVAPASVVHNWKKELSRFAPSLRVVVLNDLSSPDRKEAIKQAVAGDVVLTTYGLLITEETAVTDKEWNVICLDEAHSIKNSSTKTSAVCMQLQGKHRLILTGTPIQNHLGELWNLFQFINPGLLGSYEHFQKKYITPIEVGHDKDRQQQLKRLVQPFMLRRTKQEVVKELPDKQEITLSVQLCEDEMAIYELIRQEAKNQLEEDAMANGAASVNALAMITKLRMASCAAALAEKKWKGPSSKLEAFGDLICEICSSGNHVLVFSQFTSFLEMAKEELAKRGIKDYLYLDGSTPVKKRTQMVEQFQAGKSQLFLISLKAGGLGLNLTNANYVIHLDPWWNPAIEQQATDRAYRIGQQQKVTVYHLISEHTIEEKIVRLHQTKRDLADSLLDGTDMSHKLNAKDLLEMIDERISD